ncbi:hypothetical protein U9R62_15295 [Cylindrospermopsis raciborskii DSH]|uniref:hypothetical protein n=1 Tax=Cylindrospermopsis raciborskii TaxID=77022 RepID=UPI002ED917BE
MIIVPYHDGGQLKTAATPSNFETKNSYSRVRSTDQGGLSFERQLTINVTNIIGLPTDLTLSNTNMPRKSSNWHSGR